MKFGNFHQLTQALKSHQDFSNEIKYKRLKKQLEMLAHYQNSDTQINQISLTSIGIELLIINHYRGKDYEYNFILDVQYPFSRPQIHYIKKNSPFGYCKDLIDIILQGCNWGPSIMISTFLDKMQKISETIFQNNLIQIKQLYHENQKYRRAYLQEMDVKMFQIDQYTWKYLIKTTKKKFLGLTQDYLLVFNQQKTKQNLFLQFSKPISQIVTAKASVNANKNFELQISYKQGQKQTKRYFGGNDHIQTILGCMNPIQMIERKVAFIQQNPLTANVTKYWKQNTDMIQQFTQLIQYYSLKDHIKSEKYIKLMKSLISKYYEQQIKNQNQKEQKQQYKIQEQQIQT